MEKIETNTLPSTHQIGDKVILQLFDNRPIYNCYIDSIRFTKSKVYYNIDIFHTEEEFTTIENVASDFIINS